MVCDRFAISAPLRRARFQVMCICKYENIWNMSACVVIYEWWTWRRLKEKPSMPKLAYSHRKAWSGPPDLAFPYFGRITMNRTNSDLRFDRETSDRVFATQSSLIPTQDRCLWGRTHSLRHNDGRANINDFGLFISVHWLNNAYITIKCSTLLNFQTALSFYLVKLNRIIYLPHILVTVDYSYIEYCASMK